MQDFKRVLVRVKVEEIPEYYSINTFGAEPKATTGYMLDRVTVAISLKSLLRDGFSFPDKPVEWYEQGSDIINQEPCYFLHVSDVDFLIT